MSSGGGGMMREGQDSAHSIDAAPVEQTNAPNTHGVGTARLRMLLMGGQPSPETVSKLIADYPRERDSLVSVCMQTFGNSFVQKVIKATAQQQPAKLAEQPKPAEQVAPASTGDPHAAEQHAKESVAELNATTYATLLVAAKDDTDSKQARWKFMNVLDRVDDPKTRHKMAEKFQQLTGQSLEAFIKSASWAGKRDQQQALQMISAQRDATDAKLEKLSPAQRRELAAKANAWAEQILQVTRTKDADDDDQAVKIARVLGPRTPEEIEMIRAAIRRNTNDEHSIYEELDKSLSHGNEDEAVAGLGGDPVHSAIVGIANAGHDAERIKEILKGLSTAQLAEVNQRNIMFGPGWAAAHVPAGPDHDEIVKLAMGDKSGAEAIHITNMMKEPAAGYKLSYDVEEMQRQQKTVKLRSTDNVLAELESKSPEEVVAARDTWNKQAAANGTPTWDQMIEDRFGHDSVDARRVLALTHGKRAEDKVLALREGMRSNDQTEIERALENPDLKSTDPAKRQKAEAERAEIEKTAREYDAGDQRVSSFMTGKDVTKVKERSVDAQLDQHYKDYAATDEHSSNPMYEMRHMADRDRERAEREKKAHDQQIASAELSHDGKLSTATQYYRGETKDRAKLLDSEKTNAQLQTDESDYEKKYGKSMLGESGDRDDMNASELKIDNVRQYGVKSERRPETEKRLQEELAKKQHSDELAMKEAQREMGGGNAGTEDLVREQLAVEDSMLGEGKGPFGLGRELKQGVSKDEFNQVDENLTQSLETQREEKIKLSEHFAKIFSTIAKIAALLTAQPELFLLIDVASGLATMAIKKSIAGEAYDPSEDLKALEIDALVDVATLGVAKVAALRKAGAIGKDAVQIAEKTATRVVEEGATQEAKTAIVEEGVREVEGDVKVLEEAHSPRAPVEAADASVADASSKLDEAATRQGGMGKFNEHLETPEAVSIEGASGVSKGPNYEKFEQEAKAAAAEKDAREAAHVTEVKTSRRDGTFVVNGKYDARTYQAADGQLTELSIDVHFKKGPGISDADLTKMRGHAAEGIDKYYNFKDGQRIHRLPNGSNLHVRVNFVEDEAAADLVVSVEHPYDPMTGKELWTDQTRWLTTSGSDGMAAHELSHQMGLIDEYEDLVGSPMRTVMEDKSLMGDFEKEAGQFGGKVGVTEVKPRHIKQIAGDINGARASEAAAARVTAPMPAVAIDESKAAAETQKMEAQAGASNATAETQQFPTQPPIDESRAAAETQQMPAQRPQGPKTRGTPEKQLTDIGATKPVPLTPAERVRVDAYTNERNRFLKQAREGEFTNLRGNERADIDTARSAIRDHMSPDDLAGAIKEERGVTIESGGVPADHINEVEEARLSVVNAIENIKVRMKAIDEMGYGSASERNDLECALSELSMILDEAEATR